MSRGHGSGLTKKVECSTRRGDMIERTFNQPGFQNLVERGIRWACGDDPSVVPSFTDPDTFAAPQMTALRSDVAPFEVH